MENKIRNLLYQIIGSNNRKSEILKKIHKHAGKSEYHRWEEILLKILKSENWRNSA